MNMIKGKCCATCRHWLKGGQSTDLRWVRVTEDFGDCRANAPQFHHTFDKFVHPVTPPGHYCGQHSPRCEFVKDLDIQQGTLNRLEDEGIVTIDQLLKFGESAIRGIPAFGTACWLDLVQALEPFGVFVEG